MPSPAPVTSIKYSARGCSTGLFITLTTPEATQYGAEAQLRSVMNHMMGAPGVDRGLGGQIAIGSRHGMHAGQQPGGDVTWVITDIDTAGRVAIDALCRQQQAF